LGGFPSSHIATLKTSTFDYISYLLIASPWHDDDDNDPMRVAGGGVA
jgi:hypothetical protein